MSDTALMVESIMTTLLLFFTSVVKRWFEDYLFWLLIGCAVLLAIIFITLVIGTHELIPGVLGWNYLITGILFLVYLWKK